MGNVFLEVAVIGALGVPVINCMGGGSGGGSINLFAKTFDECFSLNVELLYDSTLMWKNANYTLGDSITGRWDNCSKASFSVGSINTGHFVPYSNN